MNLYFKRTLNKFHKWLDVIPNDNMRSIDVRHLEDELTEEEIEAAEDTRRSDFYDFLTCHEQ